MVKIVFSEAHIYSDAHEPIRGLAYIVSRFVLIFTVYFLEFREVLEMDEWIILVSYLRREKHSDSDFILPVIAPQSPQ